MKLFFYLQYATIFGQDLRLNIMGETTAKGDKALENTVYAMTTVDGKMWQCEIELEKAPKSINYFYSIDKWGKEERKEWQTVTHRLDMNVPNASEYKIYNRWTDIPYDSFLYSSAFTDCVNRRHHEAVPTIKYEKTLRLIVRAPQLRKGERLYVTGESSCLGNWHADRALKMVEHNYNEWMVDMNVDAFDEAETELKFIATTDNGDVLWETGYNRTLAIPEMANGEVRVEEMDQAFFEICDRKLAGTLIPVFSLRTRGSFGVGDFGDLKMMIDWVAETHQKVLQVLPINDTTSTHTWTDSYPYSCISIFAIHPQFADLRQLPAVADKEKAAAFEALREELNQLPQIDYERVNNAKIEYLRIIFEQEGGEVLKSAGFKAFLKESAHWLVPYAQYCHLRDTYGNVDFNTWKGHEVWHEKDRETLLNARTKEYKEVAFYYYVQYVLHVQMRAAHEYAMARGVILKGGWRGAEVGWLQGVLERKCSLAGALCTVLPPTRYLWQCRL